MYFGVINGGGDAWGHTCQWYQGNGNLHRKNPFYGVGFRSQGSQEDLLMRHHIQCSSFGKEKMKCQTCLQPPLEANDSKIVQVDEKCESLINIYYDDCREGKDSREIKGLEV